jgi:predicted transposase YdaD
MAYNELTTPIDRVSKLLFRAYPDLVVKLAFPDQSVRVITVEENVEINLPTRPVDTVMTIATTEEGVYRKLALHLEYYVKHGPDVPQTLFIYSGELTDRMQMPVVTVVVYSERRQKKSRVKPEYVVELGSRVVNRFQYLDLWLIDYIDQIRSGELAPLAPFLLEVSSQPTIETLQLARDLARRELDESRRALLLSFVVLLAGRYFDKETIRELFREEAKMLRTQTFIDEWLDEAERKGLEKGREEGREEGQFRFLLHFLQRKFGVLPADFVTDIEKLTEAQLTALFDLAIAGQSLESIEQAAQTMIVQSSDMPTVV